MDSLLWTRPIQIESTIDSPTIHAEHHFGYADCAMNRNQKCIENDMLNVE